MNKMKRVVFYVEEDTHRMLKAILALYGESMSEWLRKTIKEYVKKHRP